MKKKIITSLLFLIAGTAFVSCGQDNVTLTFEKDEYILSNNQGISVVENYSNVSYRILGNFNSEIILNSQTGVFTFPNDLANYTQVMCVAEYKNVISNPCLVTLVHEYDVADVSFLNLSNYIVDGEFVTAKASLPYAITYSLKEQVPGVSINSSTGKISFTSRVEDGTKFIVVASTHNGAKNEKEFTALCDHFVTVEHNRQIAEKGGSTPITFVLDFSDASEAKEDGVLALTTELNDFVSEDLYTFDKETGVLKISSEYLNTLYDGENILKAITSLNAVTLQVDVATKFIYTPEDLSSIGNSVESLSGYYILVNDIDLTSYLAKGGKGYNGGKGWTPIGLYVDVIDVNQATAMAFNGTFDGNGHVIKGLFSNRKDVNSFNAGLFGYTTTSSMIKNLGVQGEMNVSSYSGGFIGTNNGTVINCWSDVDITVESGENIYRYVGGFVGNNFGTIEGCYSLGEVVSDSYYGAFVGSNFGIIESCYALSSEKCNNFSGFGLVENSCILFNNENEMINADWTTLLSEENWEIVNGQLPTLKKLIKEYSLRKITISPLPKTNYCKGDNIPIEVEIYPSELTDTYKDLITYEVDVKGAYFSNNVLYTLNARSDVLNVRVSITIDDTIYSDTLTIVLGKRIESLSLLTVTSMKAGSSYRVGATYLPEDATEGISYRVSGTILDGITVSGDVVTISDDSQCSSFSIYAITENGLRSESVEVTVNPLRRIMNKPIILYEGDNSDIEIELPSYINSLLSVTSFGKEIEYELSGNTLSISSSLFTGVKDIRIPLIITDTNGRYLVDIYCMSHVRYDLEYVNNAYTNVVEINSREDLKQYFNIESGTYNEDKLANYESVFILTADIDFNGETINGIGYSGDNGFKGKLFGNGHTISNFKINNNEGKEFEEGTSYFYGVGLFGSFNGEIYDLTIDNVTITGKNFVGGFVGMMKGGKIENCSINNYSISASGYTTSHDDVHVGAIVGRKFNGKCLACYANGNIKNLIG